jgi:hypothetical protein
MSQSELLKRVVRKLEGVGIEYMVTGALASSLYGAPRSTHDVDLVIAVKEDSVAKLVEAFSPPDFHVSKSSVQEAVAEEGLFTVFDRREALKIDFWILTGSPFDQSRFARRCIKRGAGTRMTVSSPEDTILVKLWWTKQCGRSEKQFTDALRVYEVQRERLDRKYLERWAKKLRVESLWARLKKEAEIA